MKKNKSFFILILAILQLFAQVTWASQDSGVMKTLQNVTYANNLSMLIGTTGANSLEKEYNIDTNQTVCTTNKVSQRENVDANAFITRWGLRGVDNTLRFGVVGAPSSTVSYTWQEVGGSNASGSGTFSGNTLTITGLPIQGYIDLSINPTNFQRININEGADSGLLVEVIQWGTTTWTSMQGAFKGCRNLNISATDIPNLAGVTNMSEMFFGCDSLKGPANINAWNVSSVTNMRNMFANVKTFNQNIGAWNTAAVTDMSFMFFNAVAFDQNIGTWNTAAVKDMSQMFAYAAAFNQNIGAWNTAAVTNMTAMFVGATNFNQNIGAWNTAAVTNMNSMFSGATNFNQNIGAWNTAAVKDMTAMFIGAAAFNQNIGAWNTAAVTDMPAMFGGATAFNQNISSWNVSSVTNMALMFGGAISFNQDLSSWNISAVTNMAQMFFIAQSFNKSLAAWGTKFNSNVNLLNFLDDCNMDIANYDATLTGFNAGTVTGRSLGAIGRKYCTSTVDRNNLINSKGWTIDGDASGCTSTSLTTSLNPSASGTNVTFTATVTPNTATGFVTFKDGTSTLGIAILNSGVATYTTSALTAGTHAITAQYGGNTTNAVSVSNTINQLICATILVLVSPNDDLNTVSTKQASQSITATNKINPLGIVSYKAGKSILFNAGFEAQKGAVFSAQIGGCSF